mgnify:CR=1 FL=1
MATARKRTMSIRRETTSAACPLHQYSSTAVFAWPMAASLLSASVAYVVVVNSGHEVLQICSNCGILRRFHRSSRITT